MGTIDKNYPIELVKNMHTRAFKSFMLWLNKWADVDNASRCQDKGFGEGYKKAISDVFDYCQKRGYTKLKEKEK